MQYKAFQHNVSKFILYSTNPNVKVLITVSEDYSATELGGIIHVSDSQPALVMIPIIVDDDILESNETFQMEIGILNTEDRKCVALQPNVVDITIMDDDSKLSKIRYYRTMVT